LIFAKWWTHLESVGGGRAQLAGEDVQRRHRASGAGGEQGAINQPSDPEQILTIFLMGLLLKTGFSTFDPLLFKNHSMRNLFLIAVVAHT
jgi:hypothetical protein